MKEDAVQRATINIADTTLAYTVEGNGTAILVIGSSIYYPRTFSKQLTQYCKIVCADLPHFVELSAGFQLSSISFDLYTNCIEAIRLAAGLGRVVIVGHSHHGNIALEYAKRYSEHVSHVVLIGTPPANIAKTVRESSQYWDEHASEHRKALLQLRRKSISIEPIFPLTAEEAYVAEYVADAPLYWYDAEYDASWLWQNLTFSMKAVLAFRDLFQNYEMSWDQEKMKAPVLVVMGLYDYVVAHTLWDSFLPAHPEVTFKIMEESGHTPQLEQPEIFSKILLNFLFSN